MSPVLELTRDLIRRRSVTPEDAGCLATIAERLAGPGFRIEHLRSAAGGNLWAAPAVGAEGRGGHPLWTRRGRYEGIGGRHGRVHRALRERASGACGHRRLVA